MQISVKLVLFTENSMLKDINKFLKLTHFQSKSPVSYDSPIHKARAITNLFECHSIHILDWLTYSPNINSIENLWAILKGKVEKEVNLRLMKKRKSFQQL